MRPNVTDRVAWSVCRSVCYRIVTSANTAKPIEMPFAFWTRDEPGGPDPPWKGTILRGKCTDTLP